MYINIYICIHIFYEICNFSANLSDAFPPAKEPFRRCTFGQFHSFTFQRRAGSWNLKTRKRTVDGNQKSGKNSPVEVGRCLFFSHYWRRLMYIQTVVVNGISAINSMTLTYINNPIREHQLNTMNLYESGEVPKPSIKAHDGIYGMSGNIYRPAFTIHKSTI